MKTALFNAAETLGCTLRGSWRVQSLITVRNSVNIRNNNSINHSSNNTVLTICLKRFVAWESLISIQAVLDPKPGGSGIAAGLCGASGNATSFQASCHP